METTRHFTATIYVVHRDATVLHRHEDLDLWLPPGGHIERDELPHEAALREAVEETGLDISLIQHPDGPGSPTARPIPRPAHMLLEDINTHDGQVGHQHIDLIYYGQASHRTVRPVGTDEVGSDRWQWVTSDTLATDDRFDPDVARHGQAAIRTVDDTPRA